VGSKLATALLRVLDPVNGDMVAAGGSRQTKNNSQASGSEQAGSFAEKSASVAGAAPGAVFGEEEEEEDEPSPDLLPEFYMPLAKGGFLPGNLHYSRIHSCKRADAPEPVEPKEEHVIVTDTLEASGKGHFCRLTIDTFGKVDSITYLGGEELQVESLWSIVGLSETFLNHLYVRWKAGDIPDIVEFLTDEWATALFHDRFREFCQQIQLEMKTQEDIKGIIDHHLDDPLNWKDGLSRKLLDRIKEELPPQSVKAMQDHLLEYLRENTNHLKSYFLPENWEIQRA